MLLSDPPPIVMCDFDSRTARWGLDVPATLLVRDNECGMSAFGGKADIGVMENERTSGHDLARRAR